MSEEASQRPVIVQIILSGVFITLVCIISLLAGGVWMAGAYERRIESGVINIGDVIYRTERVIR